jgi:hypothetical protein
VSRFALRNHRRCYLATQASPKRLEAIGQAYLNYRENFSYEDEKFSFVSCESWIVVSLDDCGFGRFMRGNGEAAIGFCTTIIGLD